MYIIDKKRKYKSCQICSVEISSNSNKRFCKDHLGIMNYIIRRIAGYFTRRDKIINILEKRVEILEMKVNNGKKGKKV